MHFCPHPLFFLLIINSIQQTHAPKKTGSEFFSVSTDAQVLWWDIRKLSEPTESMFLDPEKNGKTVGGTVLDFETTMVSKNKQ